MLSPNNGHYNLLGGNGKEKKKYMNMNATCLAVKILGLSSFDHVKFVQVSKLGY